MPSARSLILSNSGRIDGELIRTTAIEKKYESLIQVPIVLITAKVELYCIKNVRCDASVFNQKTILLLQLMEMVKITL